MIGIQNGRIPAEAARWSAVFADAGAIPVETTVLQSAETLLDLYGEDIRARAYVTHDARLGEQMLRPDFTVPVVRLHMADGAEPARYTYQGPVWRKQGSGADRSSEVLQVGFELFDGRDPAAADAEVFSLFTTALGGTGLHAATGDLGILMAAVQGLDTIERRKSALSRHIWRPLRFRQLLDRFGGNIASPASRTALLKSAASTEPAILAAKAGAEIGLRSMAEIAARVRALAEDAAAPPISQDQVRLLGAILELREKSPVALKRLRTLAGEIPTLTPALDRFESRLAAMAAKGIDVGALDFEGSYGRTSMEYYDGFVFGFYAENRADLPVIASGGRYDTLTGILGKGRSIPAVGGVVRPEFLLAATGDKS